MQTTRPAAASQGGTVEERGGRQSVRPYADLLDIKYLNNYAICNDLFVYYSKLSGIRENGRID